MNCDNCGGGLKPVGNRSYFRCPYCETFQFPEVSKDGIAALGTDSEFDCPVCSDPLVEAAIDGHIVAYCSSCCGFLAENGVFGYIVQKRRAAQPRTSPDCQPFSPEELRRRIACPRCRRTMDTHPYHGGGNAVIDTCGRCRLVWLDAEELTVIVRYPARVAR